MTTVKIKNIEIGKGIPKICVSLVGVDRGEILSEIEALKEIPCDIVEWRADYFGGSFDMNSILTFLREISEKLEKKVLLFTFRTKVEGGMKEITAQEYLLLNDRVIESGDADIIDIELFSGDGVVKNLVHIANKNDVRILMSNHDFEKTPNKETMIKRFCRMQELGAEITKIAVTPRTVKDVAILTDVMAEMLECYADKPFVAISMTGMGVVSRISGELFGSAITFGALKKPSAPGQLSAVDLDLVLKTIHKSVSQR